MSQDLAVLFPVPVALALALAFLLMLVVIRVALAMHKPATVRLPACTDCTPVCALVALDAEQS